MRDNFLAVRRGSTTENLVFKHALASVGRPSQLWEEADPDWAPTLLLGYSAKHGDPERHARAKRRRKQARAADAERRAEADRRAEAAATTQTTHPDAAAVSSLSPAPAEDGVSVENSDETGERLFVVVV